MYYLVLFSDNKPAQLFYLFFHKHFSTQTPSLPVNSFTFCGMKQRSSRDAKFTPFQISEQGTTGQHFTRNLVNPHNHTAADVVLLVTFPFIRSFWNMGSKPRKQVLCSIVCGGTSYSRSRRVADLLFTAKRDESGVGGGEGYFCFYLEAINDQELS